MQKSEETSFDAYIQAVLAQLSLLTSEQRAVIQAELEAHLVDAAHERGCRADDPTFQAAVIAELGPARHLGKTWAQAYRSSKGTLPASAKVIFWVLWILFSTVGWGIHSLSSSDAISGWYEPLGAVVPIVLQSLLLSEVAGVRWWRSWLIVSLAPWVIIAGIFFVVDWAMIVKGDRFFITSFLLMGLALGLGQGLVLRQHVNLAGLWIVVPLISLVAAFIVSSTLHIPMVVYDLWSDEIVRIRGWDEIHMLQSMIFGAIHGAVSGTSLLALMSLRQILPSPQQA